MKVSVFAELRHHPQSEELAMFYPWSLLAVPAKIITLLLSYRRRWTGSFLSCKFFI